MTDSATPTTSVPVSSPVSGPPASPSTPAGYTGALNNAWDLIVIGSGIGGLVTASQLAAKGAKVLVLERYLIPGGSGGGFQPMPPNFGLLPELSERIRDKRRRYGAYRDRALADLAIALAAIAPAPSPRAAVAAG